jgi:ATP-dependent RNA helicase DDX41
LIGITPGGSGKSLAFILPALMISLYELSYKPVNGPFVMIIVPSRELAIQIHETINMFVKYLLREDYPVIRSILCIGGVDIRYQIEDIQKGVHIMIGTPGRLSDLLEKRKFETDLCKCLVLDEVERLLDMGFDEEIKKLLSKLKSVRQKLIFGSTMSKKVQEITKQCLNNAITINISKTKLLNYNITQDFEYIRDDSKLLHILDILQKTPPPVLIFCENKNDVDEVTEYLALKGIEVCSLHGDKEQDERNNSIKEFKEGLRDILVSTDIVSKGLDFPRIEHVINYDMPKEVFL